jgi:2-hydroxycyclohexanecarboxyl-CoA dehydrogenase
MIMNGKVLAGKVAFVAGGSGGIGSAVALALGENGADVALTFRTGAERAQAVVQKIEQQGLRSLALEVDVRRRDQIENAVASAASQLGPIDILVTAIGSGAHAFFMQQEVADWEKVWETDLRSVFYLSRAVLGSMIERKAGRIIYVSSDSGKVGNIGGAVSSSARGGIHSFTKSLAREMGRENITVNAVCPGPTKTATLEERLLKSEGHMKYWDQVVKNIPLKRVAETREVASLVVYLASPDGGFVTGQAISVSGGLTMV